LVGENRAWLTDWQSVPDDVHHQRFLAEPENVVYIAKPSGRKYKLAKLTAVQKHCQQYADSDI
jgi:hypothetical protein